VTNKTLAAAYLEKAEKRLKVLSDADRAMAAAEAALTAARKVVT